MESRRVFFVAHVLSLLPSRVSSLVSQKKWDLVRYFWIQNVCDRVDQLPLFPYGRG